MDFSNTLTVFVFINKCYTNFHTLVSKLFLLWFWLILTFVKRSTIINKHFHFNLIMENRFSMYIPRITHDLQLPEFHWMFSNNNKKLFYRNFVAYWGVQTMYPKYIKGVYSKCKSFDELAKCKMLSWHDYPNVQEFY